MQLREKELDDEAFLKEAVEIHALCQRYGVPFFVNDNVDIAIRCHAEGVHVGQEDMAAAQVRARVGESMMIGVSVHSVRKHGKPSSTAQTALAWARPLPPTPRPMWMFCPTRP
mgnify:CR=1 FL=1